MFFTEREGVTYRLINMDVPATQTWLVNNFSIWEPFTFAVFKKVAAKEKICLDLGAWIGLTGIWLSKHFKHVICVEADKNSVVTLEKNLIASDCANYTIIPHPISNKKESIIFGPNSHLPHTTLNESTSQIKTERTSKDDYTMETQTLQDIVAGYEEELGFIKCDIEGSEETILSDILGLARKRRIDTYISFHISWWKDKNIQRFKDLFQGAYCFDENFIKLRDPCTYLEGNPMGSIFIRWPEKQPPLTVLVPLYNGIEYLEECLSSIRAQIYTDWTCVVGVNGHGEDGGAVYVRAKEIVDSLCDSRFSLINIPHVKGAPQAINWMVERAPTEWIAHLDADDKWHPMKLHCQVKALETNNYELDILGTWCEYFGDATGGPAIPPLAIERGIFETMNPMIHSSILIRKELAVYTDEFFGIYDYDCWCRNLLKGSRFYNVPLRLTYHRVYNASAYNASGKQNPEAVRLKYFNHT